MLLEKENIEVIWNGKNWCVDLKKFGWENSLEEADLFRQQFLKLEEKDKKRSHEKEVVKCIVNFVWKCVYGFCRKHVDT